MNRHIRIHERGHQLLTDHDAHHIPTDFWRAADCTVQRSPTDTTWTLTAGDNVGISRLTTPTTDVTLTITAKFPDADLFFLADYAYNQRHDPLRILDEFDKPTLDAIHSDPATSLLLWHITAIDRFASRWLGRDYHTIDRTLTGKVRGRILLDSYVKTHLAAGQAHRIPCRTLERTEDTPNNQILKAGLRHAAALSHALPIDAAATAVRRHVAAALPRFAQVTDITNTADTLRRTTIRGPQRHYAPVLDATRALLHDEFTTMTTGALPTQSFMWRMPILFQEAVRGITATLDTATLDNSTPPTAAIHTADGQRVRTSKVDPDLVVHTTNGTLLLDTKYKNLLIGNTTPPTTSELITIGHYRIALSRADIYQAVAYRHHQRWAHPSTVSGLIFPVTLPAGAPLPIPHYVHGFGQPIPLLFIDIGPHARSNIDHFRTQLLALTSD